MVYDLHLLFPEYIAINPLRAKPSDKKMNIQCLYNTQYMYHNTQCPNTQYMYHNIQCPYNIQYMSNNIQCLYNTQYMSNNIQCMYNTQHMSHNIQCLYNTQYMSHNAISPVLFHPVHFSMWAKDNSIMFSMTSWDEFSESLVVHLDATSVPVYISKHEQYGRYFINLWRKYLHLTYVSHKLVPKSPAGNK